MWTFETTMQWVAGTGEEGEAAAEGGKPAIRVSPPEDLGGKAGCWTPEDLLVSAVESCLLMTLLSVVARQSIDLCGYRSSARGRMEKTPEGLRITGIDVRIDARVGRPEEIEKLQRAVTIAERYCPVSAAVKFPCHVEVNCSAA
jgi:organic hydroperoxide reductase OsmC/OhrA